MEYNTSRNHLLLPEYGRNVQNMIAHAIEIADREERNKATQAIIEVMGQLNPHLRDVDDYRHKLWTHLFIMSDFKLDVDSPYEIPKQESLAEAPKQMPYPKSKIRFGHYGKYSQLILQQADTMSDIGERDYMTNKMGTFMKKQYLLHNNSAVENTVIAKQLEELSGGELKIENPEDLGSTNQMLKTLGIQNKKRQQNSKKKQNNKKKRRW